MNEINVIVSALLAISACQACQALLWRRGNSENKKEKKRLQVVNFLQLSSNRHALFVSCHTCSIRL